MSKIERVRFNINDDLILLRQVLGTNPYERRCNWTTIHENINTITGKKFTLRAIREHVDHLVKLYKKEDTANLRRYISKLGLNT